MTPFSLGIHNCGGTAQIHFLKSLLGLSHAYLGVHLALFPPRAEAPQLSGFPLLQNPTNPRKGPNHEPPPPLSRAPSARGIHRCRRLSTSTPAGCGRPRSPIESRPVQSRHGQFIQHYRTIARTVIPSIVLDLFFFLLSYNTKYQHQHQTRYQPQLFSLSSLLLVFPSSSTSLLIIHCTAYY
ncbi:hypothetical protein QBC41DRAFT_54370 [Cercophora samala]|uniref:Uncharacterized protein n=1 Tax=Cercophora samala TaxID=330535 RepID=A0AA40DF18_9PEZI|nr:hypothetical protein QBC41DRAFT_54370 [Cercophora samala]